MERKSIQDIYTEIAELISLLKKDHSKLATSLHAKVYKVAWTTGSELLDEVNNDLKAYLSNNEANISLDLQKKVYSVVASIKDFFTYLDKHKEFKNNS